MPLSVPLVLVGASIKSAESLVMLLDAQLSIKIGYESVSNCAWLYFPTCAWNAYDVGVMVTLNGFTLHRLPMVAPVLVRQ